MACSPLARVLTASVVAQLATLPVLLPAFGSISLTSIPANIVAVPLVAIAMPLAALAAIAGLIWPPLGEAIAAPAALAATALIRTIDVLGAPEAYVSVGVPPLPAAAVIAATATLLLLVIAGGAFREVHPLWREGAMSSNGSTRAETDQSHRAERPSQLDAAAEPRPVDSNIKPLASLVLGLTREDPLDSLAAHLDDAVQNPAGEHVGHELADNRQLGQTVFADILRRLQVAHLAEGQSMSTTPNRQSAAI